MIYHFADCALDTNLYTLQRDGQTYRLRVKVFRMCLYLLEHRDRVVSRDELCTQVWPGQIVSQATLEGVIRLVRQAVGDSGRKQSIIQTLHGHGYRFVASVEECSPERLGGKAARAAAFPTTLGAAVSPESADISTDVVAGDEPETPLSIRQSEERRSAVARMDAHGMDGRESIVPGEQWDVHRRGQGAWWRPRIAAALALVALVVLGGWALSRAVQAHWSLPLEKSRIAVLPFIDLSAEVDQTSVADGITENLIAELARIPGLTVIARSSVMRYKDSLKDIATIGRELRVGTLLEGSIRKTDNQVRISAQLIDVASQGHLWLQEYDREVTGVLGIQTDIATQVAQRLNLPATAKSIVDCVPAEVRSTTVVQRLGLSQ